MNQAAMLNDIATVWAHTDVDAYGNNIYALPTKQAVRWNDEQVKFVNAEGDETTSRSVIVLSVSVATQDYIALGDLTHITTPSRDIGAYEVQGYSRLTNLRGSQNIMKAFI